MATLSNCVPMVACFLAQVIPKRQDVEVMNKLLWLVKELVCSQHVSDEPDGRFRLLSALLSAVDNFEMLALHNSDHMLLGRLWAFISKVLWMQRRPQYVVLHVSATAFLAGATRHP